MDREAWSATALGVAKSQTRLERLPCMHARAHTHTHTHTLKSNYIYGKFRKSPHMHKKRSRLIKYLGNLKLTCASGNYIR